MTTCETNEKLVSKEQFLEVELLGQRAVCWFFGALVPVGTLEQMDRLFLRPDASFISQRRSLSLPSKQFSWFPHSNITWQPPTCCALGPGTARSWC